MPPILALLTEYEIEVERLGLTKSEYTASPELERWYELGSNIMT